MELTMIIMTYDFWFSIIPAVVIIWLKIIPFLGFVFGFNNCILLCYYNYNIIFLILGSNLWKDLFQVHWFRSSPSHNFTLRFFTCLNRDSNSMDDFTFYAKQINELWKDRIFYQIKGFEKYRYKMILFITRGT